MVSEKQRAARVAPETARKIALDNRNVIESARAAQAGKAVAFWLFNIGAESLATTDAKFAEHPTWRSA